MLFSCLCVQTKTHRIDHAAPEQSLLCLRLTEGDAYSTLRFGSRECSPHIRRFACGPGGVCVTGSGCSPGAHPESPQPRIHRRSEARQGPGSDDDRFAAGVSRCREDYFGRWRRLTFNWARARASEALVEACSSSESFSWRRASARFLASSTFASSIWSAPMAISVRIET